MTPLLKIEPPCCGHIIELHGIRIPLQLQTHKVLWVMANRPGRLFRNNTLLDMAWGEDVFVEPNQVCSQIGYLRKAFGSYMGFIVNFPKRGYMLDMELNDIMYLPCTCGHIKKDFPALAKQWHQKQRP